MATDAPAPRSAEHTKREGYFVGVMSGTSLDGVDAVLADFSDSQPRLHAHRYQAFPEPLRTDLQALCSSGADEIERSGKAAERLAELYGDCINRLLSAAHVERQQVTAIGLHGQTIRHRPEHGFSVQLNAPAKVAELTGIDVIADFRSRDLAAGGHGAPLAPAFHAVAFAATWPRVVVNIGGISNVSYLAAPAPVLGFDCGPGNLLLDAWAQRHCGTAFDRDGRFAAKGKVDDNLLEDLLDDPFFAQAPPKSTGRELFSASWMDARLAGHRVSAADVQATLVELTARSIGRAIDRWCADAKDVVVCGGGARNAVLVAAVERHAAPRPVMPSDSLGVNAEQVEALAFAWLAFAHCQRVAGNLPSVTGAAGPRILGARYPA